MKYNEIKLNGLHWFLKDMSFVLKKSVNISKQIVMYVIIKKIVNV